MTPVEKKEIKKLGKRIDEFRIKKGLAQSACGVSRSTFIRIINGEHNPTYLVLLKIAESLDVSLCELIQRSDQKKSRKK